MTTQELTTLIDHYLLYLHYHEATDPLHERAMRWTILGDLYTLIGADYGRHRDAWHPELVACMKEVPGGQVPGRWECTCHEPAVLLGTVDEDGLHLKVRDRTYHVAGGQVRAVCPRCGRSHTITVPVVP